MNKTIPLPEEVKKTMPDWSDDTRDKEQWELDLEEYGEFHNNPHCPCNWEDPDGCNCNMGGLKPLFWEALALAHQSGIEEGRGEGRGQALAYIMLWAIQKTPDLERVKNESEYTRAFYEGQWDILRRLKKQIANKADTSFLRDIFDNAMEGVGGTIEWKDGYFRGAKEVIEQVAKAIKEE